MMLKKNRQQVLDEIQVAAQNAVQQTFSSRGMYAQVDMNSVTYTIQEAVGKAVAEGFNKLMDNIYSNTEFEDDMTLR